MQIALLAKKGGVGKSTLALLLHEALRRASKAAAIQRLGRPGHQQQGAGDDRRPKGRNRTTPATCCSSTRRRTWSISRPAPPLQQADLVLVVTRRPPPISGRPTKRRGSPAQKNTAADVRLVFNKVRRGTVLGRLVEESATQISAPALAPVISARECYQHALGRDGKRSTARRARRCWSWPWRCWRSRVNIVLWYNSIMAKSSRVDELMGLIAEAPTAPPAPRKPKAPPKTDSPMSRRSASEATGTARKRPVLLDLFEPGGSKAAAEFFPLVRRAGQEDQRHADHPRGAARRQGGNGLPRRLRRSHPLRPPPQEKIAPALLLTPPSWLRRSEATSASPRRVRGSGFLRRNAPPKFRWGVIHSFQG